ncbi:protein CASC4 [Scleropages formosus]|uniref:Protein GOLM2 n=1 Tax=Scleropages formosus TaxID=113540 RepID=A0A8C9WPI0_SCLFO|nr:protein CASC4 [Scleropages formosus]
MVGFGANRRGGRLPSFVLVALMVVILVLSFNYWAVTNKHGRLLDELAEAHTQVKRTDAARSRLEKRNSELMAQVDTHRRQVDQRESDVNALEAKLQGRDAQIRKCADDKNKLQRDGEIQSAEMQKLREQLTDLQQELKKQEDQLHEMRKNSTQLEKKLEYESLQCGRQIAQLKDEYEEQMRKLEEEATKLQQSMLQTHGMVGKLPNQEDGDTAGDRHTEATQHHDNLELKGDLGKPGSDAGMPGIEDSEIGKVDNIEYGMKKPGITQNHIQGADAGAGAGEAAIQPLSLDHHDLQGNKELKMEAQLAQEHHSLGGNENGNMGTSLGHVPSQRQQPLQAMADRPVLFDEDNKAVHADELGEHRGQLRAPDSGKAEGHELRGVVLAAPPNPAQVLPNPIDSQLGGEPQPAEPLRHRQSRFFDENESPVDPQHGSKLADYNGDDGNVGEYEADKQAELAYNEEEDGDGGEEDVQDDEDRELQGDRAVDYGKRHQVPDIL